MQKNRWRLAVRSYAICIHRVIHYTIIFIYVKGVSLAQNLRGVFKKSPARFSGRCQPLIFKNRTNNQKN